MMNGGRVRAAPGLELRDTAQEKTQANRSGGECEEGEVGWVMPS